MYSGMEFYTAYQGDTRSRRNQTFCDWILDLIFNATYEKPSSSTAGNTEYRYSEYEPSLSMVAEDAVPYGTTATKDE